MAKPGDSFLKNLNYPKFKAEQFVKELCIDAKGVSDLTACRQKIQSVAEETNGLLKKNVYKNYTQFIETAREISYLETELYQLGHMLSEQKLLMNSLLEISLTGRKVHPTSEKEGEVKEDETKKNLTSLLDKVEGCANILELPGRFLVYNSDLIELDPVSLKQIHRIHAFLLSDSLMLALWLPNRRGPVRYKFQVLYELENLAVVNIRDVGDLKHAFKLLMFPDTRLFSCESLKAKKEWLECIENTKKAKNIAENQKRESIIDRLSKQGKDRDVVPCKESELADWLIELPEDLDVFIAERNFEAAVQLIEKSAKHCASEPPSHALKEIKNRIDQRLKHLTTVLTNELRVTSDRSLQGGPQAARRALLVLIRLGKSGQACELFLKYRSAHLKYITKQLKTEGLTSLYIERFCATFFTHLMETSKEFVRSFADHPDCFSALVVWATSEVNNFSFSFARQVFTPQASFSAIAANVALARNHCKIMANSGLDLLFLLDLQMRPKVEKTISDAKDKLLEAIKLRAQEDKWRPMNLQNKAGLNKFLEDVSDLGVENISDYVYDECWIELTNNTVNFTKAYVNFLDDVVKLYNCQTRKLIMDSLQELFRAQLNHLTASYTSDKFTTMSDFIRTNATFLLQVLLTLVENKFEEKTQEKCTTLAGFRSHSNQFRNDGDATSQPISYV